MTRARSYCFTLNNYSKEDLPGLLELTDRAKYTIWGYEVGENSTPHLQGYVQFKNACLFSTLKNLIPRAHIETAKGNFQQNIDYCSKAGDVIDFGEKPCLGGAKRTKTKEQILEEMADPMNNLATVRYYSKAIETAKQIEIKQSKVQTDFYICRRDYPVQAILDYFSNPVDPYTFSGIREWRIITDMTELSYYTGNVNVILTVAAVCQFPDPMIPNYWAMGKPILYKHGYEWYSIRPERLVICNGDPRARYPTFTEIY